MWEDMKEVVEARKTSESFGEDLREGDRGEGRQGWERLKRGGWERLKRGGWERGKKGRGIS